MSTKLGKLKYVLILVIILLTRYFHIYQSGICLDGDMSLVGLMTKHFSEGKSIPIYFYGNQYGLVYIEILWTYLCSLFMGQINDSTIRLSMLLFWSFGAMVLYRLIGKIGQEGRVFNLLFMVSFVLIQPWIAWSLKGFGYNTSFVFSLLAIYVCLVSKSINLSRPIILGLLLSIVYQSQPLWIPGLLPFCFYYMYQNRDKFRWLLMVLAFSLFQFFFFLQKSNLLVVWKPKVFSLEYFTMANILSIPKQIFNFFIRYRYDSYLGFDHLWSHKLFSCLFLLSCILILLSTIRKYINTKTLDLCTLSVLAVIFSLSYLPFMEGGRPRYLLPLATYIYLMIYFYADQYLSQKIKIGWLTALLSLQTISLCSTYNYKSSFINKDEIHQMVNHLKEENIKHVYCNSWYLPWLITFYSNEEIIAVEKSKFRYPMYKTLVDNAQKDYDVNTGFLQFDFEKRKHTVIKNPTIKFLKKKNIKVDASWKKLPKLMQEKYQEF